MPLTSQETLNFENNSGASKSRFDAEVDRCVFLGRGKIHPPKRRDGVALRPKVVP